MANPTPTPTGFPYGLGSPGLEMMSLTPILALPQTTTKVLFTITGGPIIVSCIFGIVTTIIGAVANATKLTATPTVGGTATDICATGDINAAAAGDILIPITSFATALSINTAGVIVNGPSATAQATGFIMTPGTILVNCAGSDGGTGRVQWFMRWVPMSNGYLTAAGATQSGAPAGLVRVVSPLS